MRRAARAGSATRAWCGARVSKRRAVKIAELFYSNESGGPLVGGPSFFLLTLRRNLRCAWCDTPYTSWQPEGTEMPLDRILDEARAHPARHVVVTGGEPMIAPEILALCERLREGGFHITIETAGTVFHPVQCDLMSISPKLANSTPEGPFAAQHERLRINRSVLAELIARYEYQLKFVIEKPGDLDEARALVQALGAKPERVVLMPEGTDPDRLHERALWL